MKSNFWRNFIISAALLLVTGIIYFQVNRFEFVNYDDNLFVTDNHHLDEGITLHTLAWAFSTNYSYNWHPLTWLSFLVDYQLWGRDAGAIHLVNAALHAASAVLLFLALMRMTAAPWRSAFVAALFALHPAHVESVAWVAERKDVLSGFFWMLTLLAYVRYVEKPKLAPYLLTLGCYTLSLLAKPMAMTLPFVLLLLDYWPLGRTRWLKPAVGHRTPPTISRLLLEKAPLLILAIITAALAFWSQSIGGAITPAEHLPLIVRVENSLVSYPRYIGMMLWPIHLSVLYSYAIWRTSVVAAAVVFLAGITAFVLWRRKTEPWLLVGWFWFLGILVPVIGLVQLGRQALVDHHTYLSYIGLFIMLAWAVPDSWLRQPARRTTAGIIGIAVLAICSILTWNQLQNWQDTETLFQHVIDVTKASPLARGYLIWHKDQPQPSEVAGAWFEDGLQLIHEPNFVEAYANLGVILMAKHRVPEALRDYKAALYFEPGQAGLHIDLATALAQEGEKEAAIAEYKKAIAMKPGDDKFRLIVANGLFGLGDGADAITEYRTLIQKQSENAFIHNNLGYALQVQDKIDEAMAEYQAALRIDPRNLPARFNLASALCIQGKLTDAEHEYRAILEIRPNDPIALQNLNIVLTREGRLRDSGSLH